MSSTGRSIVIVYHTSTGLTKMFLDKVKTHAESMGFIVELLNVADLEVIDRPFHICTPTRGMGEIPHIVHEFLRKNSRLIISVAGTGNRNWGSNFCKAADKISLTYAVPLIIKVELAGTQFSSKQYATELISKFYS